MSRFSLWFWVSRPFLYPLIPIIFILGFQAGGGTIGNFDLSDWLFIAALTWPLGMVMYGINDIYDYETDKLDKTRSRLDGDVLSLWQQREVWQGVAVATTVLMLVSVLAYGWYGLLFTVAVVGASIVYSVPPVRIKSRGVFDIFFSGTIYVYGMYGVGYLLERPLSWPPVDALIISLAAIALHALGTLRDYTADVAAGNRTFAAVMGSRTTSIVVVAITILGMYLWYQRRGLDLSVILLFLTIGAPAILTIVRPNEWLIRRSMWLIAVVALGVGLYKVVV